VVSPLLISGLRFHPKGGDIRLKSVMIEDGQAACFQQPSSSAWTALNLMKGQIQFQNFVAMWLSRRRDSRHIFGLARLGTI